MNTHYKSMNIIVMSSSTQVKCIYIYILNSLQEFCLVVSYSHRKKPEHDNFHQYRDRPLLKESIEM